MYEYVREVILINIFFWPGNFVVYCMILNTAQLVRVLFYVARGISIYLFKEESWLFCCYSNFKWFMSTKTQWRDISPLSLQN